MPFQLPGQSHTHVFRQCLKPDAPLGSYVAKVVGATLGILLLRIQRVPSLETRPSEEAESEALEGSLEATRFAEDAA